MSFVYDGTSLPYPKENINPLPPDADPVQYVTGQEWNTTIEAVLDLRDAINQGQYFGFTEHVSNPNPDGVGNYLWLRDDGFVFLTHEGTDILLGGDPTSLDDAYQEGRVITLSAGPVEGVLEAGEGVNKGLLLSNSAEAANGAQQYSPVLALSGSGWNDGSLQSTVAEFGVQVRPIQGNPVTSELHFLSSIGGASLSSVLKINSSGDLVLGTGKKVSLIEGDAFLASDAAGTINAYVGNTNRVVIDNNHIFFRVQGLNEVNPPAIKVALASDESRRNGLYLRGASTLGVNGHSSVKITVGGATDILTIGTSLVRVADTSPLQPTTDAGTSIGTGSTGWSYLSLGDLGTDPSDPTTAAILYVNGGDLKARFSGGPTTEVAILDKAHTFNGAQGSAAVTLTDADPVDTDASLSNVFVVTLGGNRTLANPTNLVAGLTYIWVIKQDATGGRTLSYGTAFTFPGGTVPTLSTDPNAIDVLTGVCEDGATLRASLQKDFS